MKKKPVAGFSYGFPHFVKKTYRTDMERQLTYYKNYGVNTDASIKYTVSGFGPVFFKVDIPVTDWFGIGPVIAYSQASIRYEFLNPTAPNNGYVIGSTNTDLNTYSSQSFMGGLRFNFHFGKDDTSDPYLGFALGYRYTSITISENYDNRIIRTPSYGFPDPNGPVYFAFTFGVREYLTESFGVFAEVGVDSWSFIQAGIVLKTQ